MSFFMLLLHLLGQDPTGLLAADRAMGELVRGGGLARGVGAVLAADAAILYPGAPVASGRAGIDRLLAAQPLLDSLAIVWRPEQGWVSGAGDFGATAGFLTITPRGGGESRPGSYLAAWRRDGERWRLVALQLGGVAPPSGTVIPAGIGPIELPALPAARAGSAGPMVDADLAFAALAGKSGAPEAFRAYAAADAVLLGGAAPRRGPDAIAAALAQGPPSDWSWYPVLAGAAAAGDLGFTVGQAVIRPRDGGEPALSKYLSIWRRQPDGSIRYVSDAGNPRPKPAKP